MGSFSAQLVLQLVAKARTWLQARPRTWHIGLGLLAAALVVEIAYCAGGRHATGANAAAVQHAALHATLAANAAQLQTVHAALDTARASASAVHRRAAASAARADSALRAHAIARARITLISDKLVSIDDAPPSAAPPALIAAVQTADLAIAADTAARAAAREDREAQAAVAGVAAQETALYHARADTLAAHENDAPVRSGCHAACVVKRVALVGAAAFVAVRFGPRLWHAVHPAARPASFAFSFTIPR